MVSTIPLIMQKHRKSLLAGGPFFELLSDPPIDFLME
jgi:hypothetical protein